MSSADQPVDPSNNGKPATDGEASSAKQSCTAAVDILRHRLKVEFWLNVAARVALSGLAAAAGVLSIVYTWQHGEDMVTIMRMPETSADTIGDRILALTVPVILLVGLGSLAVLAIWVTHTRGTNDTYRGLEMLNRIRREDEVAVSARGLTYAFEEKFNSTRRAFSLQLWLGRTLFIASLGLLLIAVGQALASGVDILTVGLGVGSVGSVLLALAAGIPQKISRSLADVVQLQSIITGSDRQISILESHAFAALNDKKDAAQLHQASEFVLTSQGRIDKVVDDAVSRIQEFIEGSPRESVKAAN